MWKNDYLQSSHINIPKALDKTTIWAVLCADLHLSSTPPIWRSNEPDWWAAMARPLSQVKQLATYFNCPILCAGDIFDRWKASPEIINFAIRMLPTHYYSCYAIPGQHDLPEHSLKEIERSAFQTLLLLLKIRYKTTFDFLSGWELNSFSYGEKIRGTSHSRAICMAHQYQWIRGHSYITAHTDSLVNKRKLKELGYKVYIFGDNHCGFHIEFDGITVFNCGSLMRRRSDQKNYRPMVGLLTDKMKVIPYYLDTSQDIHLSHLDEVDAEIEKREEIDMDLVIAHLLELGTCSVDFYKSVEQITQSENINADVLSILRKAMQ